MDIIFFGTHNFASVILQGLIENPIFNIKKVITQPDRPAGRKKQLQPSAVKVLALKHGLKIDQPENLKNYFLEKTDLNIVVDYGLIIPKRLLKTPKNGSINIHPSLLPQYRGPSPIQTAIMNGGSQTGVTIMLMDSKMDHGPILAQKSLNIDQDDIYPSLSQKLAQMGKELLTKVIPAYIKGKIEPKTQNHDQASFSRLLTRDSGLVNFEKSAQEIYNQYRALVPWPGIWTKINNQRLKLLKIAIGDKQLDQGKMVFIDNKIYIGCLDNSIEVMELQLTGKKPVQAADFINGHNNLNNIILNK